MENPYANLQFQNPGNAFLQAYQQGGQQRRESETRNALAKFAQNPDDPAVFSEMSKWNPEMAIQIRQQQQAQQRAALEQHRDSILKGAQIIRQVQPKDQAGWDQARALAGQMGIDLSEVPPQFDPQYVQGLVSLADAFEPHKQQGTAMQQNYEFLKGQNPQLADSYLKNQAEGAPLIASNGDGTFTIIPRSMAANQQGGPQPGQVEDGYRFKGGNPADPNSWEPVQGGPTPQASGGFPPSGN